MDATKCQKPVNNPLFTGAIPRDPSLIFVAGIVGVPWQDIQSSTDKDGNPVHGQRKPPLSDRGADDREQDLGQDPRDVRIHPNNGGPVRAVGHSDAGVVGARAAVGTAQGNPTGLRPNNAPAFGDPGANAINGHEWNANANGNADLQYACIFKLQQARRTARQRPRTARRTPATARPISRNRATPIRSARQTPA